MLCSRGAEGNVVVLEITVGSRNVLEFSRKAEITACLCADGDDPRKRGNLWTMCCREPEWLGPGAQTWVALDSGTVNPLTGGKAGDSGTGPGKWGHGQAGALESFIQLLLQSK